MTRLETIQAAIAAGQSRRAVARSLGINDKTVRRDLLRADVAPVTADLSRELVPLVDGLHPVPADRRYIRCVCSHPAFKIVVDGRDEFECGCPRGRCHGPRQVADPDGTPQLVWAPFRLRDFGGDAA